VVEARSWLDSTKKRGMALGLKGTKTVLDRLQLTLPSHIIHVAGSNGKGTVCALMATALSLSGIENVLFTSPHVARIEERIRKNGTPLSSQEFDNALEQIHHAAIGDKSNPPIELTFFEVTYLVSMITSVGSEVLILETGLGGRLDATRSGPATASLVTSISREHIEILGSNLATIAQEKVAIARPDCPIVIRDPEDYDVRQAMLTEVVNAGNETLNETPAPAKAYFVSIPKDITVREEAGLLAHSLFNSIGFSTETIEQAKQILRWPARMQPLTKLETSTHSYLLDAAHNPSGMRRILPELERYISQHAPQKNGQPVWTLLFGTSPQQNLAEFLSPLHDLCRRMPPRHILLTQPHGGRYPGVAIETLLEHNWSSATPLGVASAKQAVDTLSTYSEDEVGLVVSLGSLYLQGNLLDVFEWASDENLSLFAKH
jgi:dihydrofolate synthase/folylpolyglutamate synthase